MSPIKSPWVTILLYGPNKTMTVDAQQEAPHPEAEDADTAPPATDDADPEVNYAVHFLTYAYTVPFRLVALQQELIDIFGFNGSFDDDFLARWRALSPPEQAAFSQSYREYRRMQALGRNFAAADRESDESTPIDERAGRFVAAHMDGLEQWQELLRGEAATAASRGTEGAEPASGGVDALTTLAANGQPPPTRSAMSDLFAGATGSGGPIAGRALLSSLGDSDQSTVSSILDSLAPIDELAGVVLEALCANEMADAQGRFLARVRWMLNLPNQQRMAVAMRTVGRKRREIAKAMGISEESVKTHLARADDDWGNLPEAQKRGPIPIGSGRRRQVR